MQNRYFRISVRIIGKFRENRHRIVGDRKWEKSAGFHPGFYLLLKIELQERIYTIHLQNVFPLRIRILNNTEILEGSMSNSNLTVTNHVQSPRWETIFQLHWRGLIYMLSKCYFQISISVSSGCREEIPSAECGSEGNRQNHLRWLQHR